MLWSGGSPCARWFYTCTSCACTPPIPGTLRRPLERMAPHPDVASDFWHSSSRKSLPARSPYEDQLSGLKLPIPAGLEVAMYVVIRKFNRMSSVAEAARRAESGLGQMLE